MDIVYSTLKYFCRFVMTTFTLLYKFTPGSCPVQPHSDLLPPSSSTETAGIKGIVQCHHSSVDDAFFFFSTCPNHIQCCRSRRLKVKSCTVQSSDAMLETKKKQLSNVNVFMGVIISIVSSKFMFCTAAKHLHQFRLLLASSVSHNVKLHKSAKLSCLFAELVK